MHADQSEKLLQRMKKSTAAYFFLFGDTAFLGDLADTLFAFGAFALAKPLVDFLALGGDFFALTTGLAVFFSLPAEEGVATETVDDDDDRFFFDLPAVFFSAPAADRFPFESDVFLGLAALAPPPPPARLTTF